MLVVYKNTNAPGWQSITYMARLAAELLEADLLVLDSHDRPGIYEKLEASLSRRSGDETCLVICRGPGDLPDLLLVPGWRKRFRRIVVWVIDSFWTEFIPRSVQFLRPYDHIFITSEEDLPEWQSKMKTPTSLLLWGSDVLRMGSGNTDREWDLIRIGRQPPEWESDEVNERGFADLGLKYHGRPPFFENADEGQRSLMEISSQSKFLLAFSNITNPTSYTHPKKEYLTARWVDSLTCGTSVAGIRPRTSVVDRLFWPGASLELGSIGREDGMRLIAEAARSWRPEHAIENYRNALKKLDWRWRFATIAEALGESPKSLQADIELLKQAVASAEVQITTRSAPRD